jgi:hypothetical protein
MSHYVIGLFLLLSFCVFAVLYFAVRLGSDIRRENLRRSFDEEHGNFDEVDRVVE